MKTVEEKSKEELNHPLNVVNSFKRGVEFSESYIPLNEGLPSTNNGYADVLVLVCVKNKNKEDGIILWDVCAFDGEIWFERTHTWEDIIGWRPIVRK